MNYHQVTHWLHSGSRAHCLSARCSLQGPLVLMESEVINEWLEERFPHAQALMPHSPDLRAQVRRGIRVAIRADCSSARDTRPHRAQASRQQSWSTEAQCSNMGTWLLTSALVLCSPALRAQPGE